VTVEVLATAKINLRLEILGRGGDGFHELSTSMLALSLGDLLRAEARDEPGVVISVQGEHAEGVPQDGTNLAHRAAAALLAEHPVGVSLELTKSVPAGAGLGGGSADAAAALAATRAALGMDEDEARDVEILAGLGSDTVFFRQAASGHALCEGRGERVTPLESVGDWSLLLITPRTHASTREVYGAFELSTAAPAPAAVSFEALGAIEARAQLFNHLEPAALGLFGELAAWRAVLDSSGLEHARLTGSGSSFFALYESSEGAEAALERVLESARDLPAPRLACVTTPARGVSLGI
jgi:4-diphosphocytidyl-2-C-methyl-D-erythritol kinase